MVFVFVFVEEITESGTRSVIQENTLFFCHKPEASVIKEVLTSFLAVFTQEIINDGTKYFCKIIVSSTGVVSDAFFSLFHA